MIGRSPAFLQAVEQATQVARSDVSVLLLGESGTGKELLAAHVHRESPFASGPFVKVNCAAIPTELVESELFGHEKGAFTGAAALRRGKFELADGGTIFLDEIGDLHEAAQAKLLRILQDGELQRVGGEQTIRVAVRVISATNRRLDELVAAGTFREDLFYRLSVVPIRVPALRERLAGPRRSRRVFPRGVLRAQQLPAARGRSGRRARCSRATPGRATSASCGTSSSAWRFSRPAIASRSSRFRSRFDLPRGAASRDRPAGGPRYRRARSHPAGARSDGLERLGRGAPARHRADQPAQTPAGAGAQEKIGRGNVRAGGFVQRAMELSVKQMRLGCDPRPHRLRAGPRARREIVRLRAVAAVGR